MHDQKFRLSIVQIMLRIFYLFFMAINIYYIGYDAHMHRSRTLDKCCHALLYSLVI